VNGRWISAALVAIAAFQHAGPAKAQDAPPTSTPTAAAPATEQFMSDDDWRSMPREERARRRRARQIAQFEPSGTPSLAKLPEYVEKFGRTSIYDPRLFLYKVQAEPVEGTTGTVVLTGEVSLKFYSTGLESLLKLLGFEVRENKIAVLPAKELGSEIYAVATTGSATMRKEPRDRAEQVNSIPLGGMVRLLREARGEDEVGEVPMGRRAGPRPETTDGGTNRPAAPGTGEVKWYLAQSLEGYLGFVRDDQLLRTAKLDLPDHVLTRPTTVTLEGQPAVLPAGSYIHSAPGGFVLYPGGPSLPHELHIRSVGAPIFTAEEILTLMEPFTGTRYVWGGVTHNGIDCSGFTQYLWKTRGVYLPRDAEEQAVVGQIVAWGDDIETAAQPGDLIFFVGENGKISHVGISLGEGRMIHSAGRGVHQVRLRDQKEDDNYTHLERALFARRVQGQ